MRVSIWLSNGTSKHWVARTSRGMNAKQKKEIAQFRRLLAVPGGINTAKIEVSK